MKVLIPEHIGDVTLNQYQRYIKLTEREDLNPFEFSKRKLEIFTKIPYHSLNNVSQKDYEELLNDIDKALATEVQFKDRFSINDVDFGFIPNFDKITTGEFVDLSKYGTDIETLHNLMAILFRPIKNKDSFNNYSIVNYNGTADYAEVMKQTPINIVNGALLFFCNLAKELQKSTQKYMVAELKKAQKHQATSKNGVGTQLSNV